MDKSRLLLRLAQDAPIPLDAHIECHAGEMLALVGPSGSGKSTILRCIAGLHRPSAGTIICGGTTWYDHTAGISVPTYQRRVGFVFQNYGLFPHMTALGNVIAAIHSGDAARKVARARDILDRVNLSGLESRRPSELSGGQQQRVAVARALARDPAVLLLDEPFSAVDMATRKRLYRELAELHGTLGIPVLLVTHDLEEAAMLANRLCILHRGRTLQSGLVLDVLSQPATPEVARLVGIHNVYDGQVAGHSGEHTLITWAGGTLEALPRPEITPGTAVSWCIPNSGIFLHRRDRPSRGDRENPVHGRVVEFVPLGESASVVMLPESAGTSPISFTIPVHVALRNQVAAGNPVSVSLLADSIHLMPCEN